jgi:2-polyprenyl-3-methyl-5-hydroxy-6-metoxy-1,4-benzoquinol methylase
MRKEISKESQNQSQVDEYGSMGPVTLGPWASNIWRHDPRHLGFLLARYKFVAKMLSQQKRVLEIGCGDATGTPIVLQTVGSIHGIDFEPIVLEDARKRFEHEKITNASFAVHDIVEMPVADTFDAAFALDVIEHIPPSKELRFIANTARSLSQHGVAILGTPNVTASAHASAASKAGHVNLKSAETLRNLLTYSFHTVFIFSMNDEIVHTGFYPMAQYLLGVGVGVRTQG